MHSSGVILKHCLKSAVGIKAETASAYCQTTHTLIQRESQSDCSALAWDLLSMSSYVDKKSYNHDLGDYEHEEHNIE